MNAHSRRQRVHGFRAQAMVEYAIIVAILMILLGPIEPAQASTLIVPNSHPTIQAAINAAIPGDTIIVRSGTYVENLTLNKPVILTAESFDANDPTRNRTVIDGGASSTRPTILIPVGVSSMPTLRGFLIRNGQGGMITRSPVIVEYNYFISPQDQIDYEQNSGGINRHNVYFASGDDAIDLDNMNQPLVIENNRMMYSGDDGIEIRLHDASAPSQPIEIMIRNNEIIGCNEDGIQFIDYSETQDTKRRFVIAGNLIANCTKAGIGLMPNANTLEDYSGANIREAIRAYNNTIYGNDYGISGGDNLVAFNNIIANSITKGVSRVQGSAGANSVVAYTLFHNNGLDSEQSDLGAGNLFGADPLFAYPPSAGPDGAWRTVDDDFSGLWLQAGSPAVDAGTVQYIANSREAIPPDPIAGFTGTAPDLGWGEFDGRIFMDVPASYWAASFIERLYVVGITGGCSLNPLRYCPEASITRDQMAVFLLRGIHDPSYAPPGVGAETGFADVPPTYWAAAFIKQLAAEGITTGCGNDNYCPDQPVTRAQMAVFLLRSKHGASYSPPDVGAGTGFGDVPSTYWAATWIKQLVTEGITSGCGSGNYCPEDPVTRAQMAVFLVKTFNLP
jgi:hypothetical protein